MTVTASAHNMKESPLYEIRTKNALKNEEINAKDLQQSQEEQSQPIFTTLPTCSDTC